MSPKQRQYRESLGKFGPAFVRDLFVVVHIQAGQGLVDLQEIDREDTVSGATNQAQNIWKFVEGVCNNVN